MDKVIYVGIPDDEEVLHVETNGIINCGAEVEWQPGIIRFERIEPTLVAEEYRICLTCEPSLRDFYEHRDAVEAAAEFRVEQSQEDDVQMTEEPANWRQYERHFLSEVCGNMPDEEFWDLRESIENSDEEIVVTLFEGEVLDGWHRYLACLELDRMPTFAEYTGRRPGLFVIQQNVLRRHLNAAQRGIVINQVRDWEEMVKLGAVGALVTGDPGVQYTQSELAGFGGMSERTFRAAKRANDAGLGPYVMSKELSLRQTEALISNGLHEQIIDGDISLEQAKKALAQESADGVKTEPLDVPRDETPGDQETAEQVRDDSAECIV